MLHSQRRAGLYYAWEGITRCDGDEAQVNLLLNRAAPWLDVHRYLPYEGKVVIQNKMARRIAVRIPLWVNCSKLLCTVNGDPRGLCKVGAYQVFDDLRPGDRVELTFPVAEETVSYTASIGTEEETVYTMRMRSNTVTDISPRDDSPTAYSFYLRDHLKGDEAPLKKVRQIVAPVTPRW